MHRNSTNLLTTLFALSAGYNIVALQYAGNGRAEYVAVCADGARFEVEYDSGWESYRLALGEVYATFDLAASRACSGQQRTVPGDFTGDGIRTDLPAAVIQ